VQLPSALEVIETGTFYGCTSLAQIDLPDTLTEIGSSVFLGCDSLK